MGKNEKTFNALFYIILIIFLIIMGIICCFPYWFQLHSNTLDFTEETGKIGDTIGGTMGPFVAIGAALLTFLAFWVQFKANEQQRYDIKIERFENKFYELIRLHRANIQEIDIDGRVRGRLAFQQMINELRHIHSWVLAKNSLEWLLSESNEEDDVRSIKNLNLAYKIFFFGIGYSAERQLNQLLSEEDVEIFKQVKEELKKIQQLYDVFRDGNIEQKSNLRDIFIHSVEADGEHSWHTLAVDFKPFTGRSLWLGHYYRHLFQSVGFVDSQSDNILKYDEKRKHLNTLRAQLSNDEQVLLYYNALSDLGNPWLKKEYFKRYFMLKNIPLGMIDIGLHPHYVIGIANEQKKYFFEWDELKNTEIKTIEQLKNERDTRLKEERDNQNFADGL